METFIRNKNSKSPKRWKYDGVIETWHRNGTKASFAVWKDGIPIGIHRWYNEFGTETRKDEYIDGLLCC